tara:strand:+ start:6284 stop:6508 length:225 start_codon:yes stop_codon:yes gene_type:complete
MTQRSNTYFRREALNAVAKVERADVAVHELGGNFARAVVRIAISDLQDKQPCIGGRCSNLPANCGNWLQPFFIL